jgi:hypothetical protein
MNVSKAEKMREREAKINKYKMFHYNEHDAELLAQAEIEMEEEKEAARLKLRPEEE